MYQKNNNQKFVSGILTVDLKEENFNDISN